MNVIDSVTKRGTREDPHPHGTSKLSALKNFEDLIYETTGIFGIIRSAEIFRTTRTFRTARTLTTHEILIATGVFSLARTF